MAVSASETGFAPPHGRRPGPLRAPFGVEGRVGAEELARARLILLRLVHDLLWEPGTALDRVDDARDHLFEVKLSPSLLCNRRISMSCAITLLLSPASNVDWLKRFRSN